MRGIKTSNTHEEMIRHLTHPVAGKPVFDSMRTLVCFAAVLGFEYSKKVALGKQQFEAVDGRIFENSDQAVDLLYLIALAHEKDPEILRVENEEKMVAIFEQFAQGGFEILAGWLREKPEDTVGDRAIVSAFGKYGFLSTGEDSEVTLSQINF
jgi:dnd system-associated protein 4